MYGLELLLAVPLSIPCIALGWIAILVERYA